MGYRDLARFQYRCGELQDAVRSYTKSREYCTTSQHVLDMCMGVIEVSHLSFFSKRESTDFRIDIDRTRHVKLRLRSQLRRKSRIRRRRRSIFRERFKT